MACEAGLGVGLGQRGAAEEIGDRALARARAADHGEVQRRWRLSVEKRADTAAHQRGGQAQLPRPAGLVGLPPAVFFQPAEVVGQLAGQRSVAEVIHYKYSSRPVQQSL